MNTVPDPRRSDAASAHPLRARRRFLASAVAAAATAALPARAVQALPAAEVFRSPSCGCCGAWVEHLKSAGFAVKVTAVADPGATRQRLGLADRFRSCHTALVAGYVIEGHVPAADVKRLLATKPAAIGLAVPGMPAGSPGMESGGRRSAFDVLLIDRGGRERVFARYPDA